MICKSCSEAATTNNMELHELCTNNDLPEDNDTNCDCMHRTGPTAQHIQPEQVARMREAGLPIRE